MPLTDDPEAFAVPDWVQRDVDRMEEREARLIALAHDDTATLDGPIRLPHPEPVDPDRRLMRITGLDRDPDQVLNAMTDAELLDLLARARAVRDRRRATATDVVP